MKMIFTYNWWWQIIFRIWRSFFRWSFTINSCKKSRGICSSGFFLIHTVYAFLYYYLAQTYCFPMA